MPPSSTTRQHQDDVYQRAKRSRDKTPEQKKKDEQARQVKAFLRFGDMWTRIQTILLVGIKRVMNDNEYIINDDEENLTSEQRVARKEIDDEHFKAYNTLLTFCKGIDNEIMDDDDSDEYLTKLAATLEHARRSARQTDTNTVKENIHKWYIFDPLLFELRKSQRGYKHPHCGFLLTPVHLDWNKEEDVQRLLDGTEDLTCEVWYTFMYENYVVDKFNLDKGFLRSELLVKAYLAIFIAPSAAVVSNRNQPESRATREGNAALGGVQSVNFESIAYIATQVRFALSSESHLSAGDYGKFNHCGFYRDLVKSCDLLLEDEKLGLLQWWNKQVFPFGKVAKENDPAISTIATFKLQMAQKRAERVALDGLNALSDQTNRNSA